MDRRASQDLDRHITGNYGEDQFPRDFCNREWGICPDSVSEGFPGEPHLCYLNTGHHQDHVCGTCDAQHPLSPDETSSLEEPLREQ